MTAIPWPTGPAVPRVLACVDVARSRAAGVAPLDLAATLADAGADVWWRDTSPTRDARLRAVLARLGADRVVLGGDPAAALAAGATRLHLPARALGAAAACSAPVGSGASVHDAGELAAAVEVGVAYVTVSPVWPTASKPGHPAPLGLDGLRRLAVASPVPVLALGGVTIERAAAAVRAGAYGVAAIAPFLTRDPVEAYRLLAQAVAESGAPRGSDA